MTISQHIFITGVVQGVGYRYTLRQQAMACGVTGWCRNLPDGRVEAVVQGEPKAVKQMVNWCYTGPTGAVVTDVLVSDYALDPTLTVFEIRRG